jgi:hypothetical protein
MSLPLPGERPSHTWELILALVVVFGLCALGCAGSARSRRAPPSLFQGDRSTGGEHGRRAAAGRRAGGDESAALVERRLHVLGLRFGTDGTVPALWGYLRAAHRVIPAAEARPGDVLLFDAHGTDPQPRCADHAGLVERVANGRISFVEARAGQVRRSVVDPAHPGVRRDADGRVLNSFLRPKVMNDPPGARYFAGDMLCAVVRVAPPQ